MMPGLLLSALRFAAALPPRPARATCSEVWWQHQQQQQLQKLHAVQMLMLVLASEQC
jgi:hypothetical protein